MTNPISPDERYKAMDEFSSDYEGMADGAFFALAKDMHGWDTDDWVWYWAEHDKRAGAV